MTGSLFPVDVEIVLNFEQRHLQYYSACTLQTLGHVSGSSVLRLYCIFEQKGEFIIELSCRRCYGKKNISQPKLLSFLSIIATLHFQKTDKFVFFTYRGEVCRWRRPTCNCFLPYVNVFHQRYHDCTLIHTFGKCRPHRELNGKEHDSRTVA